MVCDNNLKSGVVEIYAQTTLTSLGSVDDEPIDFGSNATSFNRVGNGIFIKGGFILALAQTVVVPPFFLANNNKFPFDNSPQPVPSGQIPPQVTVASVINATIRLKSIKSDGHNTHPCGVTTYSYRLEVLKVDGQSDLALLRIAPDGFDLLPNIREGSYEVGNPRINQCAWNILKGRVHEFSLLKNNVCNGDNVRIIGSTVANHHSSGSLEPFSVIEATVTNAFYTDPSGWILSPLTILDAGATYFPGGGAPVIDKCNNLIGILAISPTGTVIRKIFNDFPDLQNAAGFNIFPQAALPHSFELDGQGKVGAIAFPQIKTFLNWKINTTVKTVHGNFKVVNHGFLGLSYVRFIGPYYTQHTSFDGSDGVVGGLFPDITSGSYDVGPPQKPVNGIYVTALAGDSSPAFLVPGQELQGIPPFPPNITNSNLNGIIPPGSKIDAFHIRKTRFPVGVYYESPTDEMAPYSVISLYPPGEKVIVEYSLPSPTGSKYQETFLTPPILLTPVPSFYNFPYYAAGEFPFITGPSSVYSILPPPPYSNNFVPAI